MSDTKCSTEWEEVLTILKVLKATDKIQKIYKKESAVWKIVDEIENKAEKKLRKINELLSKEDEVDNRKEDQKT